jgi:hypothetical protein
MAQLLTKFRASKGTKVVIKLINAQVIMHSKLLLKLNNNTKLPCKCTWIK